MTPRTESVDRTWMRCLKCGAYLYEMTGITERDVETHDPCGRCNDPMYDWTRKRPGPPRGDGPDGDGVTCFDCGEGVWYNVWVSDEVWSRICPDPPFTPENQGGVLCVRCIDRRCADLGLTDVPGRFRFIGAAVTIAHDKLAGSPDDGDVLSERDFRGNLEPLVAWARRAHLAAAPLMGKRLQAHDAAQRARAERAERRWAEEEEEWKVACSRAERAEERERRLLDALWKIANPNALTDRQNVKGFRRIARTALAGKEPTDGGR